VPLERCYTIDQLRDGCCASMIPNAVSSSRLMSLYEASGSLFNIF